MINSIVVENLDKYKNDIDKIDEIKGIDCVTIFSTSDEDYEKLNLELKEIGNVIDEMSSGNLFFINDGIDTIYGKLYFIKVRKFDGNYLDYRISVDFTVCDYDSFKSTIKDPVIKIYDTFELIQFKNKDSIINVISLSAKDDYKVDV